MSALRFRKRKTDIHHLLNVLATNVLPVTQTSWQKFQNNTISLTSRQTNVRDINKFRKKFRQNYITQKTILSQRNWKCGKYFCSFLLFYHFIMISTMWNVSIISKNTTTYNMYWLIFLEITWTKIVADFKNKSTVPDDSNLKFKLGCYRSFRPYPLDDLK